MAYADLADKSAGDAYTHEDWNQMAENFDQGAPGKFTAKGDQLIGTGSKAAAVLAAGTDGHLHTCDAAQATGTKWAASGFASCAARYKVAATQTIANTTAVIMNYGTSTFDADSAVTTGASWKFTCPAGKAGKYKVIAARHVTAAAFDAGEYCELRLYKEGSQYSTLGRKEFDASGTLPVSVRGSDVVELAEGDEIDVRMYQNSGGTVTADADGNLGYISIVRLQS